MKYLKRFNESVDKYNVEEIKQTIREILLPISDMGYEISVNIDAGIIIRVVSYTDPKLKMNDEVKDEFIRMVDYLESSGFNSIEALYVKKAQSYKSRSGHSLETTEIQERVDFSEFITKEFELRNLLFFAKVS
jgi:hypothetical protein